MKNKSISTLGYIMEQLNIHTVSMSQALHVDASLVSKWKRGNRVLSPKSVYFDDIIDYLLQESTQTLHQNLKDALLDIYPQEEITDDVKLELLLRQLLSSKMPQHKSPENKLVSETSTSVSALIFNENSGRREAVQKMLDYAETMTNPGEFLFVDSEEFGWLLENPDFAKEFVNRIENLIHRGFHATFVINYSSYKERLQRLFDECSSLIFHRNINWYYNEYYDQAMLNYSIYILNKAISLLGFSAEMDHSTMIFTDTSLVLKHELFAQNVIKNCHPLFNYFDISEIQKVIFSVSQFRKNGSLYSFLPSPLFISAAPELLKDILASNGINNQISKICLEINHKMFRLMSSYLFPSSQIHDCYIYIFQIEELLKRARKGEFISQSLSLSCGRKIVINAHQYATELRNLADALIKYDNLQIVLASKKDHIFLPNINCWCKKNTWMVQMNKKGLRLSDEYSIVHAASTKWERCIRQVPSERKNPDSVRQILLELAEQIEQ